MLINDILVCAGMAAALDDVNGILARVLIDLTASMRFAGDLNVPERDHQ
jgi:hypothetical protein